LKSVGLITFHASHNYGSVFQAYALQQTVLKTGYHCEIINLRTKNQLELYSIITKRRGIKYLCKNGYNLLTYRDKKRRYENFEHYIAHRYILSARQYRSLDDLMEAPPQYDYYISGSDQIWNPAPSDFNMAYFLPFVSSGKKIAYAPSFGPIGELDQQYKRIIKELLKDYACVSAREKSGAQLLEQLLNVRVPVLIDPTMLLDECNWMDISKPVNTPNKYILFYTLFAKPHMLHIVKEISKRLKLPIVTPYVSNQYDIFTDFIRVTECGPEQFLSLIRNTELVVTSSFHGSVLSILCQKPFFAIDGLSDMRLNTLLSTMSLKERAITLDDYHEKIDLWNKLDFKASRTVLVLERKKAVEYLWNALEIKI
jgi:hypothetical protein